MAESIDQHPKIKAVLQINDCVLVEWDDTSGLNGDLFLIRYPA